MLTAFTAALILITVSELGDKTFFIAVILSMRYPRRGVLIGVVAALAAIHARLVFHATARAGGFIIFFRFLLKQILYGFELTIRDRHDERCLVALVHRL
jgi:putative Ca2+/H+ antiporter (TMEM165/GDT1 family)